MESSKILFGAFLGVVLAIVTVSGLGYLSGPQQTGFYATPATAPAGERYQANVTAVDLAAAKSSTQAATIQSVSQTGFSGNLVLILTFVIPLAFAITAYLAFKKR